MLKEYYEIVEKAKANPYGFEHALLDDYWFGTSDHTKESFIYYVVSDEKKNFDDNWKNKWAQNHFNYIKNSKQMQILDMIRRSRTRPGISELPAQEDYPELKGLLF